MSKHTTLVQAHKIKSLSNRGWSVRKIAAEVGVSKTTVSDILNGKCMLQQQQLADRMEAFIGGVIIGTGNTRFHASDASLDEDNEAYCASRAHHPFDVAYENGQPVPTAPDILSVLLAEEDLIERIVAAGLDPNEFMVVDHDADTDDHAQLGGDRETRDPAVHTETWEQFNERTKDLHPGARMKTLDNEGIDVDAWAVRKNPEDTGLWGTPWVHPRERGE